MGWDFQERSPGREWRFTAQRPWLLKLFGAPPVEFHLTDATLTIRVAGKRQQLQITELLAVTVNTRWVGTWIRVICRDGTQRVGAQSLLLTKEDAQYVAAAIGSCILGKECKAAYDEFDKLLKCPGYLNWRLVAAWHKRYQDLSQRIQSIPIPPNPLARELPEAAVVNAFREIYKDYKRLVAERNDQYVTTTAEQHADFFAKVEKNPLTPRQIEAVLRDEDHVLVMAGAGTGKTSTVVAKVAFLLKNGEVKPNEVLALAFTRNAKAEMEERIKSLTGHEIEVRTFHSLARQIVIAVEGEKMAISSMAEDEVELLQWISLTLSKLLDEPKLRHRYTNFVLYHRYPARFLDEFCSHDEYEQYVQKQELRTLRGERVKSFEELQIAHWLTLNGIRYEYEYPYQYKTANHEHRQYKPDFYLPDYGIYIEHFGIGRDGSTVPWIDKKKYHKEIEWKREIHRRYGTKLIETYSYERKEGILLKELERKLREAGVQPRPLSDVELRELIEHKDVKLDLVTLLKDFLTAFKANLWSLEEVRHRAKTSADQTRANAFLDLFEIIFDRYQARLKERQEMDFADLIAKATKYVKSGAYRSPFRRIIVDEFQDISRGRLQLLLALLRQVEDARLFCVGDDWQSIFGFTGSDVGIMTSFPNVFGYTYQTYLNRTFRLNDRLLRVSSHFVQKNPAQLQKELVSSVQANEPVIYVIPVEEQKVEKILHWILGRIDKLRPSGKRASVLLLARYNFHEPKDWQKVVARFSRLDVDFMTVHKAKGLEADYVVLLNIRSGRYGFPSEIASDPIMSLVIPQSEKFKYAEERRVFYVALTRARHKVFILSDPSRISSFVEELLEDDYEEDVICILPAGSATNAWFLARKLGANAQEF